MKKIHTDNCIRLMSDQVSPQAVQPCFDRVFEQLCARDGRQRSESCGLRAARWKIENESFNVLKNSGYNLARNFGHGNKCLARIFAAMNLPAFAFHTACDCLEMPCHKPARLSRLAHASFRISTPSAPTSSSPHGTAS